MAIADVPYVYRLDWGGPKVPEMGLPRDGLTFIQVGGRRYCMSSLGRTGTIPANASNIAMPTVCVCKECFTALEHDRVPPRSLVRVDTGPWPTDDDGPLPVLTPTKVALVTPVSVARYVTVFRPSGADHRPSHMLQKQLRGHIIVSPSVSPSAMASVLPRDLNDLPDEMLVRRKQALPLARLWVHPIE